MSQHQYFAQNISYCIRAVFDAGADRDQGKVGWKKRKEHI